MTADQILHPLVLAATFIVAAILKLEKKALHEVFSYFVAAGWFILVYFFPNMTVDTVRVVSRWVFFQIPIVVIFFHFGLWWFGREYKKALGS